MKKIDPIVWREAGFIAASVAVAGVLVQGVCLAVGWWNLSALLGTLLGSVTAVGNFLLMGLMIQKAVTQEQKAAANTVRLSQGLRLLMQGAILVVGALVCNIWTTAIPLLVPRAAITLRQWLGRQPAAPVSAGVAPEEDDEDEGGDGI